MSITRSFSATAVLLAASQSCGFVSTRHHRQRRINRHSLAPSVAYTELHHLHLESAWDGRRDAKGERDASRRRDAPITKPGLVTQLGGWSYARTLFSDSKGFRQENRDGEESGSGRDTLQSASSDGGSTTTATSRSSSRVSSTDDGGDDDDDDAWDADGHTKEDFEITCNGDVCERRPIASPGVAETVVDKHGQDRIDAEAKDDEKDHGLSQLISMGWDANESAKALAEAGGNVLVAAEALAAREEDDMERYKGGLAELMGKGWDEDTALSAMREAGGNTTAALMALEDDDRMLSMQFERSIEEMVEHGWDEEVARKALLMQWQKDIENGAGGRKAQKQFEKTVQGVKAQGEREGQGGTSKKGGKKRDPSPATEPTPAKRDDVVFDVTDKNLQKVVLESPVPVVLDVYADWCGPCKQLTPALEEAAMRSGGMFRLAKVDAEKHRVIAEVLGIRAYPSIFGVKEGVIVDNFVGILPQEEMQAFMMGLVMGLPPNKDKPRREHQRGEAELRSLSRKLAHIAGLAAIGSRKKEQLCLKVDRALSEMLPDMAERDCSRSSKDIALAKRAGKVVSTILMSAYKFPEDPKFRRLSTSGTVYTNVLAVHPPMLEVLRLAGFRKRDGDDDYLHLLHRNMAVLASVKDRVELWDKAVKVPIVTINDEDNIEEKHEDHEEKHDGHGDESSLEETKLKITKSGVEGVIDLQMAANATLRDVFEALQEGEELDHNLVLTTNFPKRELSASDPGMLSSTLLSLGLVPSARLMLTDSEALAAAKVTKEQQSEMEAKRKEGLRERMIDKSQDARREKRKKRGTLFGVEDGIVQVETGKHVEYFGGDSTVTVAGDSEETGDDADSDDVTLQAGMGNEPSFPEEDGIVDHGGYEESGSEYDVSLDDSDGDGCFIYDSSETEEEW